MTTRVACSAFVALIVAAPASAQCVNINTGSFEELQRIIHTGPDRAAGSFAAGLSARSRALSDSPASDGHVGTHEKWRRCTEDDVGAQVSDTSPLVTPLVSYASRRDAPLR